MCPSRSCSTSTALASVITAIVTALLATVIVQIAVCKCHPKFTPGGAETGTSAGGEGQEYEEVDGCKVAVSDPTYMEVDGGGGRGGRMKHMPVQIIIAHTHTLFCCMHSSK